MITLPDIMWTLHSQSSPSGEKIYIMPESVRDLHQNVARNCGWLVAVTKYISPEDVSAIFFTKTKISEGVETLELVDAFSRGINSKGLRV
jgi:hypothetical protein